MFRLTPIRIASGLFALFVLGAALLWFARKPIADEAIRRALATRGIDASYTVKSIGLRWERIENVRIGDPRAPDLTAEWAEIRVVAGLGGIGMTAVRAGGVRLRGRIVDGRLRLGQVDKLLPKSDGKTPFAMPDLAVDLADARLRIDSPWGPLGARIDGAGNLADGFAGRVAAIAPKPAIAGCGATRATAYLNVTVRSGAPTLTGQIRADALRCGDIAIARPALGVDVALNAALDMWKGTSAVEAQAAGSPDVTVAALKGKMSFEGNATDTRGAVDLNAPAARYATTRMSGLSGKGRFATRNGVSAMGRVDVARLVLDAKFADRVDGLVRRAKGSPLDPLLAQLATSVRGASEGLQLGADAAFSGGSVTIAQFIATGANGATFRANGGSGLRFGAAGFVGDTQLSVSGGGFPAVRATLQRRADGMTLGTATIGRFVGGGSDVAFDSIRFAANSAGAMRLETAVLIDGPLSGGRVDGLRVPVNATIAANGNIVVNNGCTPVAFRMVAIADLVLGPAAMRLCPVDGSALFRLANGRVSGGASIDAPRLAGRLGGTAVEMRAGKARVMLATNAFVFDKLSARLGMADRLSSLEIGTLSGAYAKGALTGRFGAMAGRIANVPLLVGKGQGNGPSATALWRSRAQ